MTVTCASGQGEVRGVVNGHYTRRALAAQDALGWTDTTDSVAMASATLGVARMVVELARVIDQLTDAPSLPRDECVDDGETVCGACGVSTTHRPCRLHMPRAQRRVSLERASGHGVPETPEQSARIVTVNSARMGPTFGGDRGESS